jgi:hypothetical protein
MKGYRIEIALNDWVQYIVAESDAAAKYDVWSSANENGFRLTWKDIRSCRRCPQLDGLVKGYHATYQLIEGVEKPIPYGHNRTEIHA